MKYLFLLVLVSSLPVTNAEKVKVADIEVKYKIIGEGDPILLINGFGNTLDSWHPDLLQRLAEKHAVITFDNRGVGNSTSGEKKFTIKQFAKDTDAFLTAINITKVNVLGVSMGGMIAQELALFSNRMDKLIIQSSHCGQHVTLPSKEVQKISELKPSEIKQKLREEIYPKGFDYSTLPNSSEVVSDKTLAAQQKAISDWNGTCDKLSSIKYDTLVLVGKGDNLTPPANSLLMAKNIKGAWLIQIEGGHPIATMYPDKVADIVLFFINKM